MFGFKSKLLMLSGAVGAIALAMSSAQATPFRLDYSVTDIGGTYQYDFDLVLDNNDGSWNAGQEFDWFVIGDARWGNSSPFSEGGGFFTSLPAGWNGQSSIGGHNGPTLGYGGVSLPGYSPLAIGDVFSFTGVSSTLVANGELRWSNLLGSYGNNANYEVANQVSAVPVPAALPLALSAFAAIGFFGWRRKKLVSA
ncbi:MAG: hypothetical protein AAGA50_21225 [Pseudomonadota bacterium]